MENKKWIGWEGAIISPVSNNFVEVVVMFRNGRLHCRSVGSFRWWHHEDDRYAAYDILAYRLA